MEASPTAPSEAPGDEPQLVCTRGGSAMKKRILSISLLGAITLALVSAAMVSQRAAAQCGGLGAVPIPCGNGEKQKRPTPTDTRVPSPTPPPSATAVSQAVPVCTPDTANLVQLCSTLGGGSQGSLGQRPPSPNGPASAPTGFLPYLLGGLGGLLIGLLLPAVRNLFPGWKDPGPPGRTASDGNLDGAARIFDKHMDAGGQWNTDKVMEDGKLMPGAQLDGKFRPEAGWKAPGEIPPGPQG